MTEATNAYQAALTELEEAQRFLGTLRKRDPERAGAKVDVDVAMERIRYLKEAGIASPLHEALVARLDPSVVLEIEAGAFARLEERGEREAREERDRRTARLGARALVVRICAKDDLPATTFVVDREIFTRHSKGEVQ